MSTWKVGGNEERRDTGEEGKSKRAEKSTENEEGPSSHLYSLRLVTVELRQNNNIVIM